MSIDSVIKRIAKLRRRISQKIRKLKHSKMINRNTWYIRQIVLNEHIQSLKNSHRHQTLKCLIRHGRKMYSQNEEDGMIQEIFNRIGTTNRKFVELGSGDGLENNTLALLLNGWHGLWIEASPKSVNDIQEHFYESIRDARLQVVNAVVTDKNINALITDNFTKGEIDLLSIDIDGNDIHIFNAISVVNPRVVVIEYNAKFFPPMDFCVTYDPAHSWRGDDYMGASLTHLEAHFRKKGYSLVGCDLSGTNAFFLKQNLLGNKFLSPYTSEVHYEPARYHLVGAITGHAATYHSVQKALSAVADNNSQHIKFDKCS